MSAKEAADILHCHPQTIYRNPNIPRVNLPGIGARFKKSSLEAFISANSNDIPLKRQDISIRDLPNPLLGPILSAGGRSEMAKAKSKSRCNLGYGAVYVRKTKRGNVRWYLDYRDAGGKRVQKLAVHAASEDDAIQALRTSVLNEHHRTLGLPEPQQRLEFSEFSRTYLDDYARQNKKSWRDDQYRLDANMIPFFKSSGLHEITPHKIEQYKAHRLKSEVTRSTVNRELTILKKMFNLAVDWGLVQNNPALKVKLFTEKDTQKERILSYEEEAKLMEESPDYLRPILIVALNTGMRRGEILNLRWDQVDLEKRQIAVRKTKSGKDRLIPINARLLAELSLLGPPRSKTGLLFPNPATGKPYADIKKSFKLACRNAGIEGLRFHDLRHTFASRLVEAGVDIVTVRDLLGHFSIKVTQRYTHPGKSKKFEAVELLIQKPAQNGENLLHPCYTN